MSLPKSMRAIVLREYRGSAGLAVEERPIPTLKRGQVLVKVHATPINPSDTLFINGQYGFKKPVPVIPGFEGSGVVVASGGGFMANRMMNKPVICANQAEGDGLWAEYFVASALSVVPIAEGISLDQASTALVNPLTAWAIMEMAQKGKHRAIIHTAAASALGKMLIRLQSRFGVTVINIVRREEQLVQLKALGAKHALNSNSPDFDAELYALCQEYNVRLAFDAVAGELTGRILHALCDTGRVRIYGNLSLENCKINPSDVLFHQKTVDGFWMSDWIKSKNLLQLFLAFNNIQKFIPQELSSDIRAKYGLQDFARAIQDYEGNMTGGKVLFAPNA